MPLLVPAFRRSVFTTNVSNAKQGFMILVFCPLLDVFHQQDNTNSNVEIHKTIVLRFLV